MEIPIELFSMFMGLTIVMIVISLLKNIPMVIVVSGVIMIFLFSITDTISRGSIPDNINDNGVITWIEDSISFNTEMKIVFVVIGALIVLVGGIMQAEKKDLISNERQR